MDIEGGSDDAWVSSLSALGDREAGPGRGFGEAPFDLVAQGPCCAGKELAAERLSRARGIGLILARRLGDGRQLPGSIPWVGQLPSVASLYYYIRGEQWTELHHAASICQVGSNTRSLQLAGSRASNAVRQYLPKPVLNASISRPKAGHRVVAGDVESVNLRVTTS